jgi:hypothetical protein
MCYAGFMHVSPFPRRDEPKPDQPLYVVVVKTSIRFRIPGHISQYCKLYLNVINLADWFVVEVVAKRIRDL